MERHIYFIEYKIIMRKGVYKRDKRGQYKHSLPFLLGFKQNCPPDVISNKIDYLLDREKALLQPGQHATGILRFTTKDGATHSTPVIFNRVPEFLKKYTTKINV